MLSRTAEYALLATVCLGHRPDATLTSQELADASGAPGPYLANVLKSLVRFEILASRPGRQGGYFLAAPAHKVSLLDVVNAVDPQKPVGTCRLGTDGNGDGVCRLHAVIHETHLCVARTLDEHTVADMIGGSCLTVD